MRHENVTYSCDSCGKEEPGEEVRVSDGAGGETVQTVLPRGWIKLGAKVRSAAGGKPHELRGEFCSTGCVADAVELTLDMSEVVEA